MVLIREPSALSHLALGDQGNLHSLISNGNSDCQDMKLLSESLGGLKAPHMLKENIASPIEMA